MDPKQLIVAHGPYIFVLEPSINDDTELEVVESECSALNPGSEEDDEEDSENVGSRRRNAAEFSVEGLSNDLREVLEGIDYEDDIALRESSREDLLHFNWSHDPHVFRGVRETFAGPAGPTFPIEGMSPFQIFSEIWDRDITELIVRETNKYAASLLADTTLGERSRLRKWQPITLQDLWTFFGILMLQSIVPLPVEKEYWVPCLTYLKLGNFSEFMPCYRFALIEK